jgi:hypothetical protein
MAAPISAAAVSVGEAAVPALLVAPGNLPSALGAGERRAPAGAVDLSPIAATADQHLRPAALAEEEAAGVPENGLVTAAATWTQNGVGAIISRQSCPARFRARRRCELPSCRSAPRLLPRPVERLKHATRSCQRPPAKPRPPDLNHPADNLPRAHPRVHPTGPQATSHGLHGIPRRPPRKPQSRRRRRISALPDARHPPLRIGSFAGDEDTSRRSISRRSSLRQAQQSRGVAIMGRAAASVSVIHAGSSSLWPFGSSTTKCASSA